MNSQFGNHNYDPDHDRYLREKLRNIPDWLREEAEKYDWSPETIASKL